MYNRQLKGNKNKAQILVKIKADKQPFSLEEIKFKLSPIIIEDTEAYLTLFGGYKPHPMENMRLRSGTINFGENDFVIRSQNDRFQFCDYTGISSLVIKEDNIFQICGPITKLAEDEPSSINPVHLKQSKLIGSRVSETRALEGIISTLKIKCSEAAVKISYGLNIHTRTIFVPCRAGQCQFNQKINLNLYGIGDDDKVKIEILTVEHGDTVDQLFKEKMAKVNSFTILNARDFKG